jgi:hypothetical protein
MNSEKFVMKDNHLSVYYNGDTEELFVSVPEKLLIGIDVMTGFAKLAIPALTPKQKKDHKEEPLSDADFAEASNEANEVMKKRKKGIAFKDVMATVWMMELSNKLTLQIIWVLMDMWYYTDGAALYIEAPKYVLANLILKCQSISDYDPQLYSDEVIPLIALLQVYCDRISEIPAE